MKAWNWIAIMLFGAGAASVGACTSDPPVETDDGGTTTTMTSTSTVTTTSTSTTTSTTMPTDGVCMSSATFGSDVVDGCLSASCCDTFNPCFGDMACAACLADPMGAGCDTNTLFVAFNGCFDTTCPTSVCMTDLGTASPNLNACINANACPEFNACEADMVCNACLADPMGTGCDTNVLYQAYDVQREAECPSDICGAQILYAITYDNMAQDVAYDSNKCATDNCCTQMHACADPSMDGYLMDMDPESQACLDCLAGDPGCMSNIAPLATAFTNCFNTNCP